ncbi:hypothetical protein DPEC_G00357690 [Dallia pectoralis]|uniref:Uncharacterized protein n=1 Tax=Dallia pectoralis TaxID=75939 RepID=A0ACC2F049_DALPE|nr:hypothetical protein DPEC_G00357690 [Dallia pectoralis]
MEIEESFSSQRPGDFSPHGSGGDFQFDAEQSETIPEEPNPQPMGDEAVSMQFSQGSWDLSGLSSQLAFIAYRRGLLHRRRIMLLKIKHFRNKSKGPEDVSSTVSFSEESSELEEVEQELLDLVEREKDILQILINNNAETEAEHKPASDQSNTITCQGVYVLPPCGIQERVTLPTPKSNTPSSQSTSVAPEDIVDVKKLHNVPAIVRCPFCEQVVTTKTYRKIGSAPWILCFLSGILGCVAGCCLIPFCLNNLKDVYHSCPECHKKICTSERF